jgi:hypothetical protein
VETAATITSGQRKLEHWVGAGGGVDDGDSCAGSGTEGTRASATTATAARSWKGVDSGVGENAAEEREHRPAGCNKRERTAVSAAMVTASESGSGRQRRERR